MFNSLKRKVVDYNGSRYELELSPLTNTIRFSIDYKGAVDAFVLGDFNDWKKKDDFKLKWNLDTSDGNVKMIRDITFQEGLRNGEYKYGYLIIDSEGNEVYINNWNQNIEEFSFNWEGFNEVIEIKSSANFVSEYYPTELVLVKKSLYGNIPIEDSIFYLESKIEGVHIEENILKVSEEVKEGTEIIIVAIDEETKRWAKKTIIVRKYKEKGSFFQFIKGNGLYFGDNFSWNIWSFDDNKHGEEVSLNFKTDLGRGEFLRKDKFILRKRIWGNGWVNDWSEQTNTFNLNKDEKNIYLIYENNKITTSLKEAIKLTAPKIEKAIMDNKNKIRVFLSHEPIIGIKYFLYINGIKVDNISTIVKEKQREVLIINFKDNIEPSSLLEIRASSMFSSCKVMIRDYLENFYYGGNDLGVTFKENTIRLKLWAPTAKKVEVLIYKNNEDLNEDFLESYEMMKNKENGTFKCEIFRNTNEEKYYLYRLYFNEIDEKNKVYTKITYAVDPYVEAVGLNGKKGALISLTNERAVPYKWNSYIKPKIKSIEDSIIYEMHIRDFTISETSGVSKELRGKFLGAAQEGTVFKNKYTGKTVKTGLDHLKELGVTHIHLLPVFDFKTVDESIESEENRNWGYDPQNFNAIEGSYSTNPRNPYVRIKEFREMIKTFHENGLMIVMDVVYNHMYDTKNMDNIVPGYYFRSDIYGNYTNGSGCGNEIATERPMIRKFIIDSILHLIRDFHIDGLRFDLMELIDLETMKEIVIKVKEINENILIYGEPWKGGNSEVRNGTYKGSQKGLGFSIFNDDFRDALRGDNSPSRGFINGDQHNKEKAWKVIEGLKGSINTITYNPIESINYLASHDNYTIWDQIVKTDNYSVQNKHYRDSIKELSGSEILKNYYVKENILGASLIFTAQGIPFIQSGAEFLRTKEGDYNSYKSSDKINAINWAEKEKFIEVFNYYKGLIKLRRNFNIFKMKTQDEIRENLNIYFQDNNDTTGVIIAHFKDNNSKYKDFVIIYNSSSIDNYDVNRSIPIIDNRDWYIIADEKIVSTEPIGVAKNGYIPGLKAHSMMIICK